MRISDWSSDVCSSDLLHSMPAIPQGQPGHGARIVVGDRFGDSAGEGLVEQVMTLADRLGVAVARNQPYAGGHVVRTHGRPDQGVEAVQIEIDRDLYLAPDRMPDAAKVDRLSRWF